MKTQYFLIPVTGLLLAASACSPAALTPTTTPPPAASATSTRWTAAQPPASRPISTLMEVQMSFQLTSTDFTRGNPIPARYTCTGENVSPALAWSNLPAGTQSFALIMDDPDAPGGTWTHWVLYNLPASTLGLPEDVPTDARLADGSLHGKNSWGKLGYGGPCPPSGTHRYFFKLYALDRPLDLPSGANAGQLLRAMQGRILGQAELMGTYRK